MAFSTLATTTTKQKTQSVALKQARVGMVSIYVAFTFAKPNNTLVFIIAHSFVALFSCDSFPRGHE
jgi:hypothetical protein